MASYELVDGVLPQKTLAATVVDTVDMDGDGWSILTHRSLGVPIYYTLDGSTPAIGVGDFVLAGGASVAIDGAVDTLKLLAADAETYIIRPATDDELEDFDGYEGAAQGILGLLKGWASGECYEPTAITRDSNDVVTSATVVWPDGSAGTFTATTVNATWNTVDAYTITHTGSGKTVTQTAVTRNSTGAVTTKPALTVS